MLCTVLLLGGRRVFTQQSALSGPGVEDGNAAAGSQDRELQESPAGRQVRTGVCSALARHRSQELSQPSQLLGSEEMFKTPVTAPQDEKARLLMEPVHCGGLRQCPPSIPLCPKLIFSRKSRHTQWKLSMLYRTSLTFSFGFPLAADSYDQ